MTRFIKYLNERNSLTPEKIFEEFTQVIEKKCSHYLTNIVNKNKGVKLYSGRKGAREIWFEGKVRKNRKPRDTIKEIHDIFNYCFQKNLGSKLRSESLFCGVNEIEARGYGEPYYIFPIGNDYKLWYHPEIKDLFLYFSESKPLIDLKIDLSLQISSSMVFKNMLSKMKKDEIYKNEVINYICELTKGYKQGLPPVYPYREIMLDCKEYIAVNVDWIESKESHKQIPKWDSWLWG